MKQNILFRMRQNRTPVQQMQDKNLANQSVCGGGAIFVLMEQKYSKYGTRSDKT